jgi:hypothetical protein
MDCGICIYTYELSSCCTLKFKVGDKEFVFNLEDTKVFSQNSSGIIIKDNTTTLALSNDELAAIPLTIAEIEAMICECRNQVLGGAVTPDYEAGNYTLLCDSADPSIYYLAYFTYNDGAKENHYITLPSGVDTIGNLPSTAIPCKEPKVITSCYNANGVLYTNIICLSNNIVISSLWLNMDDNSVSQTMPVGAVPCKDQIIVCTEKICSEIEPQVSQTQGTGLITGFTNQEDFSSYANGTYTTLNNTIGGINYTIQHRDFNLPNPLLGTLRSFIVENPITQNGATLPQKGIETIGGGTTTYNAFVFSFATPISAFGANILDAESNVTFGEAQVILYDSAFNVIHTENSPSGANAVRWIKLQSTLNNISYAVIKVGDEIGGSLSDQIAVTNVSFETTTAQSFLEIKKVTFLENGQLVIKYFNSVTGQEILDIQNYTIVDCEPEPIPQFLAIRIPVCINGVNHVQQVVYLDGVLQSGVTYFDLNGDPVVAPTNFTLGWCESVDYEITTSPVCIAGLAGIKKQFYEDNILIATEFSINGIPVVPASYTDGACGIKKIVAVEEWCATKQGGDPYYLVYKGSYQDYLNSGGDPNAIDLGTFAAPYDGWLYAGICAASLPNPVDNWEWTNIASPIYGYNGGNQYGPLTLIPNGNTLTCGLVRKDVEKIKFDDYSVAWVEDSQDHSTLLNFDPTGWTLTSGACPVMQEVTYVECNVEQTAQVEKVVGAYVLNNKYQHTENVYDVVQATITGTITPTVTGNVLIIPFAGLTVANLNPVTGVLAVDFGSGYLNFGTTPDQDFTNQPNGEYEAKIYYIAYIDGRVVYLLLGVCEFTVTNGVPTITSNIPINVNRNIDRCVGSARQQYCGNVPIADAYDPLGNSYAFQGSPSFSCPRIESEYFPNGNSDDIAAQVLGIEIPNGITYTNNLAANNPQPSIVKSITLTKQSGGIVEVSFDSGATYPLRLVANGSRTWGQGNQEGLNVGNMRFRQLTNGVYDLIWEI